MTSNQQGDKTESETPEHFFMVAGGSVLPTDVSITVQTRRFARQMLEIMGPEAVQLIIDAITSPDETTNHYLFCDIPSQITKQTNPLHRYHLIIEKEVSVQKGGSFNEESDHPILDLDIDLGNPDSAKGNDRINAWGCRIKMPQSMAIRIISKKMPLGKVVKLPQKITAGVKSWLIDPSDQNLTADQISQSGDAQNTLKVLIGCFDSEARQWEIITFTGTPGQSQNTLN